MYESPSARVRVPLQKIDVALNRAQGRDRGPCRSGAVRFGGRLERLFIGVCVLQRLLAACYSEARVPLHGVDRCGLRLCGLERQ
jgi:hypothetical protein